LDGILVDDLMERYGAAVTCFCFMGGDADPSEIQGMAGYIREKWPHLKVGWYSGRESLPEGFDASVLAYLKLGPYIAELGGLKSPTTNQKFYIKSPEGEWIEHKFVK
jgi:anaerobic ribonucleoside-triphosphate reductase activating protein